MNEIIHWTANRFRTQYSLKDARAPIRRGDVCKRKCARNSEIIDSSSVAAQRSWVIFIYDSVGAVEQLPDDPLFIGLLSLAMKLIMD